MSDPKMMTLAEARDYITRIQERGHEYLTRILEGDTDD